MADKPQRQGDRHATPRAGIPASSLAIGTLIRTNLGNFFVVQQGRPSGMYDTSCNGTWLLMKDVYENRQWHNANANDYANSTIRSYLDSTFLNRFDANIRNAIKTVKIPYRPGSGKSQTINGGSNGLSCKIFLLSGIELGFTQSNAGEDVTNDGAKLSYFIEGNSDLEAAQKRLGYLNGNVSFWWMRSPYTYYDADAGAVHTSGGYSSGNYLKTYGVRPALVLPSDCPLHPTPNADGSYNLL